MRSADFDSDIGNKFFLVQPMQGDGVRYKVKHSGDFLYKISNEEDRTKFKVTKIRMPHEVKVNKLLDSSPISSTQEESTVATVDSTDFSTRLGKKHEIAPVSKYLEERGSFLLPLADGKNPETGLVEAKTIYEPTDSENVIQLELFKNYMSLIVEKDGQR